MRMLAPLHPGAIIRDTVEGIREETGQKLTYDQVAKSLDISRNTLASIMGGRAKVTPEVAVKLSIAFETTSPEFWLRLQQNYDLAQVRLHASMEKVHVLWSKKQQAQRSA